MSAPRPIEPEGARARALLEPSLPAPGPPPISLDPELETGHHLPHDHPAWMRDTVSVSHRMRALLARLRPVAIRVATFWDHRVPSIAIAGHRLAVDAAGCYRLE